MKFMTRTVAGKPKRAASDSRQDLDLLHRLLRQAVEFVHARHPSTVEQEDGIAAACRRRERFQSFEQSFQVGRTQRLDCRLIQGRGRIYHADRATGGPPAGDDYVVLARRWCLKRHLLSRSSSRKRHAACDTDKSGPKRGNV
jgi:hypothetical protein